MRALLPDPDFRLKLRNALVSFTLFDERVQSVWQLKLLVSAVDITLITWIWKFHGQHQERLRSNTALQLI
jgi:hypothetical protein